MKSPRERNVELRCGETAMCEGRGQDNVRTNSAHTRCDLEASGSEDVLNYHVVDLSAKKKRE
eukprot:201858-Hanusia_phi.AAC.1